jgi:uncharacterized protein
MAQPNVSREPSMEEILASIRRIIESNEPVAANSYDSSYGYEAESDELDVGNGRDSFAATMGLPTPANQPGPSNVAPVMETQADLGRAQPKSVSLADLAARVRATTERAESLDMAQPAPAKANAVAETPVANFTPERISLLRDGPLPQARIADVHHLDALEDNRRQMDAMERQPVVEEQVVAEPEPEMRGLLSMQAGAQVARSFEELAAAVDGQQRRSLDEIAQDMLRPMLQDWLDDNLPTLVERLVREEIERIARGPRR